MWTYNELYHHGILGQKWGVRRFQNADGSLTEVGRVRYSDKNTLSVRETLREINRANAELKLNNKYEKLNRKYKRVAARQKLGGIFGAPGRFIVNITGRAVLDRVKLQMAEDKLDKALDSIGSKYVIKYDSSIDAYHVVLPEEG